MCLICQTFQPYKETCDYENLPVISTSDNALLEDSGDAGQGTSTSYSMVVNDTFEGSINSTGDRDWVALNVVSGQSYDINLSSLSSNPFDTYLRLYDSSGNYLGFDDDGGAGTNSHAWFTAEYTGVVYISAGAYNDNSTGDYQIAVTPTTGRTTFTNDQIADQLTNGYWESDTNETVARMFDISTDTVIDVNISNLAADGQQLAQWAFEAWSAVSPLTFNYVTDPNADIIFQDTAGGAYNSSTSTSSGTPGLNHIIQSTVNVSTNWLQTYGTSIDSYSFQTYMHEIGHALGLGHAGNYNGSAAWNIDNEYLNDSWDATVMSYFSQIENPNISSNYAFTSTLMMADIIAIQNMYGSGVSHNTGNTVYGYNSTLTNYLGDLFGQVTGEDAADSAIFAGNPVTYTLFDTGGIDTLDMSGSTLDQRVDMNDETYSDLSQRIGNFSIARGTELENYIGGSGADDVTGNELDNDISGNAGNDDLKGGAGADTIDGGTGNDTMSGGAGADLFEGTSFASGDTDTITDFNGAEDVVDLSSFFTDFSQISAASTQTGNDLHINLGGGTTLILQGTTMAELTFMNTNTACFCGGTQISTPDGPRLVEHLAIGDKVLNAQNEAVDVLWIGRQRIATPAGLVRDEKRAPVCISAGALDNHTDLFVSADHGMIVDGLVINASALVNGTTIRFVPIDEMPAAFTYYHIETEAHDVILANGALSETFIDVAGRAAFDNYAEYLDLYGAERIIPEMRNYRISTQRLLPEKIKARLGIVEDVIDASAVA